MRQRGSRQKKREVSWNMVLSGYQLVSFSYFSGLVLLRAKSVVKIKPSTRHILPNQRKYTSIWGYKIGKIGSKNWEEQFKTENWKDTGNQRIVVWVRGSTGEGDGAEAIAFCVFNLACLLWSMTRPASCPQGPRPMTYGPMRCLSGIRSVQTPSRVGLWVGFEKAWLQTGRLKSGPAQPKNLFLV